MQKLTQLPLIEHEPPVDAEDRALVVDFITEAAGHVGVAEAALQKLLQNPSDTAVINTVFRSFHTIKGAAGCLNLRQLASLAHSAENLLVHARQPGALLDDAAIDSLFKAVDLISGVLTSLSAALKFVQPAPPADPSLSDLLPSAFHRIARTARNVARKTGKEIELITVGGETPIQRECLEAVSDALMHMVHNAADHGIEPPDQRLRAGKSRAGRIELRVFEQAGSVVIEVRDDGRGLNRRRIVEKAVAAGIVATNQVLEEQAVFQLIFHPGLSTAQRVTEFSGRGVGMDVVKENIDALHGQIDIASVDGQGTTFVIRLPVPQDTPFG